MNVTFTACHTANQNGGCHSSTPNSGSAVVTAQVPNDVVLALVEGTHYTFSCTSLSANIAYLGTGESTCTLTFLLALDQTLTGIRLSQIGTTITGNTGWTASLHQMNGNQLQTIPGTYNFSNQTNLTLLSPTYQFLVRLENTACSPDPFTSISVSMGIQRVGLLSTGAVQYTPSRTLQSRLATTSGSATATVQSIGGVTAPYRMTQSSTHTTNLVINYGVTGCGTWNGNASMGSFVRTGSPGSNPVPTLTQAEHISNTTPVGAIISYPGFTTIGPTSTSLIRISGPGTPITLTQTIRLTYVIPANTPVGEYTATITVSTQSGP